MLFGLRHTCPDAHVIKLGTMGEYGTPNIDIEEGWLEVEHNGRRDRVLFPKRPGSFYHLSKVHDSQHPICLPHLGLSRHRPQPGRRVRDRYRRDRATSSTPVSTTTRCLVQCSTGSSCRRCTGCRSPSMARATRRAAFSTSAIRCGALNLRSLNPPKSGEFRVFNQFTEQFSVMDLAERVKHSASASARGEIATLRIRVSRRKSTTTTRSTPSCSTSASSRLCSARSWSSRSSTRSSATRSNVIEGSIDPHTRWNPANGAKTPAGRAWPLVPSRVR